MLKEGSRRLGNRLADDKSMYLKCGLWARMLPSQILICDGKEGTSRHWQYSGNALEFYLAFFCQQAQGHWLLHTSGNLSPETSGKVSGWGSMCVFVTLQPGSLGSGYCFVL